jgi:CelD/BcsL family acetyltransferase involved in cellulose biosynthesis
VPAGLVPLGDVGAALAARWSVLADGALEPNPYAHPDFVLPAGRRLPGGAEVGLLVVENRGELRFALPVVRIRRLRGLPVHGVGSWLHPYCFLGTPLVSPADPEATWAQALDVLAHTAPLGMLGAFGADGEVAGALARVLGTRRQRETRIRGWDRPVLHRRAGAEVIVSNGRRRDLRRRRRQLGEALGGPLESVVRTVPGPDLDGAVDGFLAMERSGWKGRDGGAMACHPGHDEFFREMCRRFAASGNLRLRSLGVGPRVAAYDCSLVSGRWLFGFKMTYDERLRRYGPGVALMIDGITDFLADPRHDTYDSCTGTEVTIVHELLPGRRAVSDLLLPLPGLLGRVTASALPGAVAAFRRVSGRAPLPQPGLPAT